MQNCTEKFKFTNKKTQNCLKAPKNKTKLRKQRREEQEEEEMNEKEENERQEVGKFLQFWREKPQKPAQFLDFIIIIIPPLPRRPWAAASREAAKVNMSQQSWLSIKWGDDDSQESVQSDFNGTLSANNDVLSAIDWWYEMKLCCWIVQDNLQRRALTVLSGCSAALHSGLMEKEKKRAAPQHREENFRILDWSRPSSAGFLSEPSVDEKSRTKPLIRKRQEENQSDSRRRY